MSWAYWKQVLIALDQVLNTLLCGFADETLSSALGVTMQMALGDGRAFL